jgi:hypothetical protein
LLYSVCDIYAVSYSLILGNAKRSVQNIHHNDENVKGVKLTLHAHLICPPRNIYTGNYAFILGNTERSTTLIKMTKMSKELNHLYTANILLFNIYCCLNQDAFQKRTLHWHLICPPSLGATATRSGIYLS